MAAKPLTTETIALTEKKMDKVRQFMDSRSSLRQAALAQRRSNFQGNQFPLATEAARKAVVAPIRNRAFNRSRAVNVNKLRVGAPPVQRKAANGGFAVKKPQQVKAVPKQRPQTLDSLFANMKEQRMRVLSQQNNGGRQNGGGRQRQHWGRGRFGS
uniref:Uncharacterized protein n=1 Tax=Davidia involucrata TaxID=16924 RepID=A0A5B6ZYC6_DAVIN